MQQRADRRDAPNEPIIGYAGEAHAGMVGLLPNGEKRGSRHKSHFGLGEESLRHERGSIEPLGKRQPGKQAAIRLSPGDAIGERLRDRGQHQIALVPIDGHRPSDVRIEVEAG